MSGSGDLPPLSNPQSWDVIVAGGMTSPGVIPPNGMKFTRKYGWDVKKGKGTVGGTVTFVGREPAEGNTKFQLWTDSQFVAWSSFVQALQYDPTKTTVTAVDVFHPSLSDVGINSLVVKNIGAIEHVGGQLYEVNIEWLEYFPPPPQSAVGTPTMATGSSDTPGTTPPAAQDAEQKEIADLLAKANQDP